MFGLKNFFSKSYIYGLMGSTSAGMAEFPRRDFLKLYNESYKINPTVYACISEIATTMSGIPWNLYKKQETDSGERELAPDTHWANALLRTPNQDDTWGELLDHGTRDFQIGGNQYYLLVDRQADQMQPLRAPVVAMWQIHPNNVRAVRGPIGVSHWIIKDASMKDTKVDASRVIHIKTYNAEDPTFGMAPIEAAARDSDTMNESLKSSYNTYRNGGTPAGLVLVEGAMGPDQKKAVQADIDKGFNDPINTGRWKLVTGAKGIKFEKLASNAKEMESSKQRYDNAIAICGVFGVPPEIIGIPGTKTFSNYKEARKSFYEETILPLMEIRREKFNKRIIAPFDKSVMLDYDTSEIEALRENETEKIDRSTKLAGSGIATANEARKKVGLPPATDPLADVRMIPLNAQPADEARPSTDPGDEE